MTRYSISDKLRQQVIERADGICEYCGNQLTFPEILRILRNISQQKRSRSRRDFGIGIFQIDHIYPQALGGSTTL